MKIYFVILIISCFVSVFASASLNDAETRDAFYATVTDRTGTSMEVSDILHGFGIPVPSPAAHITELYAMVNHTVLGYRYKEVFMVMPFANIDTIEFADEPPTDSKEFETWSPSLIIKLKDGSIMQGTFIRMGRDPYFSGNSELGDFSMPFEKVCLITFHHERDKTIEKYWADDLFFDKGLKTGYTVSIKTWDGNRFTFLNSGKAAHDTWRSYRWTGTQDVIDMKVGESNSNVKLDKIKNIVFQEKGKPNAQMTSISGKTFEVSIAPSFWLGGVLDKIGPGKIQMSDINSIEVIQVAKPE